MKWIWAVILFTLCSCSSDNGSNNDDDIPSPVNDFLVDSLATAETVAWDLGDIQNEQNLDGVNFMMMRQWILQAYQRGGMTTISMHLDNPVTGGDAWDNAKAVAQILPGKSRHQNYLQTLGRIADFLASLKTLEGVYIPVIFRPYHEHNQTWSWWGKSACTAEEYSALWEMTVEYLRDTRSLHHLLYTISPQDISGEADYLDRYPGDEWVDILGMDYYKLYNTANITNLGQSLDIVAKLASLKNKVCALTEVGLENVTIADWWTHYLLTAIQYNVNSRKTAWVLTWRNASESHHFAPYPGHSSTPDFITFYNSPFTIFENDLPEMYH